MPNLQDEELVQKFLNCKIEMLHNHVKRNLNRILQQNGCCERVLSSIPPSFSELIVDFTLNRAKKYNVSLADALLTELYSRNTVVRDVLPWLEAAELGEALMFLKPNEPVEITEQPIEKCHIYPSDELILTCKAKGFPTPKYQWFKDTEELILQQTESLNIKGVTYNDEGTYWCKVYNIDRRTEEESQESLQSRRCSVKVERKVFSQAAVNITCNELRIIRDPVSQKLVEQGGSLLLRCEADSPDPSISYQWFENKELMIGKTDPELKLTNLYSANGVSEWTYSCLVSDSKKVKMSKEAKISLRKPSKETQYFAKRKLALLIGNGDYEQTTTLNLPSSDVVTLSNIFKEKGFTVFAFQNLTKTEIKNAVEMFSQFLEEGDYCVFYFVGHGFEFRKFTFIMPVEANLLPNDSISEDFIIGKLQSRNPALIFMLFDMCRKTPDITINNADVTWVSNTSGGTPTSNMIKAYATSQSCEALEITNHSNGVFVEHLEKFLNRRQPIKDILSLVKTDMHLINQSPMTEDNLSLPLSLYDFCEIPVIPRPLLDSLLDEFKSDLKNQTLEFQRLKASVLLEFDYHRNTFLNSMDIVVKIRNLTKTSRSFDVLIVQKPIKENSNVIIKQHKCVNFNDKKFTVFNIQRLQRELSIMVVLRDNSGTTPEVQELNLKKTLISREEIWVNKINN